MQPYAWTRRGWSRRWVLTVAGREVAELDYSQWSWRGTLAAGQRRWSLRIQGMWRQRLHVLDEVGREVAVATLPGWGVVVHAPSGTWVWRSSSWWRTTFELRDAQHQVRATMRTGFSAAQGQVDAGLPDAALLLAIGWVAVLYQQAATAAVVVATT